MDKKELQKKLNQPYSTQNWQEVVQFVFPNVQIFNPVQVIPIDVKHKNIVENFNHLGNVQLSDGKILSLLELKLKDKVNIIKNRVQLNEIVSSYIDTEISNGVLSIFEKGTDDYRFSFVARSYEFSDEGDLIENKTHAKRFTYVLGKNESCKTPALQFFELSNNKKTADINAIIKAFNITKLNKDFFDEYKDIYNNIVEFFTGKRLVKTSGKWEEKTTSKPDTQLTYIFKNNELDARNFTKMLLGRLVFLKFVQKKGWLGVSKERTDWKNGNIRFLEEAYENFKHKELFYSTFLSPLFFEALNNPNRKNDVFKLTDSKVPYLSGGLFDEDNLKTSEINIPKKHFDTIFEFLDRYNFTIDENVDIEDKNEFSIDPEMLGHIFENLLEDNKDKGAFYTPKEIVRYMCQESLKEYLKTSLENNKQWPTDETEAKDFEQALHNYVTKKEANGVIDFDETIAKALKEVKICDPAIGSGAFPMGLLNEIFQLVHKLHEVSGDKLERIWGLEGWQPNLVKQNIIQNSIYGVDIEKGAVDVARLRFWLSLIVDEPEPKALPHLDYKIVVGNSLVSKLDDTIIDIDWNLEETEQGFFGSVLAQERADILQKISEKQKAVFDPNSDEEKLSLEIRNLKIDLLCKQLELMISNQNIPKEPKIADYHNKPKAKFVQDQNKYFETLGWKNQIIKLEKLKKRPEAPLHFFDWKLDFPEIMNGQVTDIVGFDIVIGNPPYVDSENMIKNMPDDRDFINRNFMTAKGNWDLYVPFHEIALNLIKITGIKSFITPNKWLSISYASEFRKMYINKLYKICNCNRIKVFDAGVSPVISFFKKTETFSFTVDSVDSNFKFTSNYNLTSSQIDENSLGILLSNFANILLKIKEFQNKFGDYLICENPFSTNEAYRLCSIIKDNSDYNVKHFKLINTGTIDPYISLWGIKKTTYLKNKFLHPIVSRKKLEEDMPKRKLQSNSPKLIITGMRYLECFYDKDGEYIAGKSTLIIRSILNSKYEMFCGLINSKLISFYIKQSFSSLGIDGGVNFTKDIIHNVPLPKINLGTENLLTEFVKKIHFTDSTKEQISYFKNQIDNLIYKLYELTYDEVLVVEPEFSERMSKAEYEDLQAE